MGTGYRNFGTTADIGAVSYGRDISEAFGALNSLRAIGELDRIACLSPSRR